MLNEQLLNKREEEDEIPNYIYFILWVTLVNACATLFIAYCYFVMNEKFSCIVNTRIFIEDFEEVLYYN